jgi:hypothetical protein
MSHHRRQSARLIAPVLLALLTGCPAAPGPAPADPPPAPVERYGSLAVGWTIDGPLDWAGTVYAETHFWRDRDLTAWMPVVGLDGVPAHPRCLVLVRSPADWNPATGTEVIGNAGQVRLPTALPGGTALAYEWGRSDRKKELLKVGKREFSLADGRVFLIVVGSEGVSVHQLAAGMGGLFDSPPDYARIAAEVQALRQTSPPVQRFWAGEYPDAEDG